MTDPGIYSDKGECPFCRATDQMVAIQISEGVWPDKKWIDSTLRRCANEECWTIREGSNEHRLAFIVDQYNYKYFGDYELAEPQREAVNQALSMAAMVPHLLAALVLAEDVLARFPFTSEIWPNGTHPNTGIGQIREAIAHATPEAQ